MHIKTTLRATASHFTAVVLCAASALALLLGTPANADDAAATPIPGLTFSGIVAGSVQDASKNTDAEGNLQLDILLGLAMGPGAWNMEVKAGTSPATNGVSAYYPEATGLVGELVDSNNKGRAGITQLYYEFQPHAGIVDAVDAGLVFSPAYIDNNEIADDEYRQFMGTTFVNNPTIPLPVYVLGGAVKGSFSKAIGYTFFASSTADLQGNTYSNLFDFQNDGHGAFVAGQINWDADIVTGNVGAWVNTDESFTNFSSGDPEDDYGVFGNVNGTLGSKDLKWNVRLGWANPQVSQAEAFVGAELAYDTTLFSRPVTYGLGASYTAVSSDMTGPKADREQVEAYSRVMLVKHVSVTADLQYLNHSQFDPNLTSVWIGGLRAGVEF
jgi:hypothetical protein